MWEIRVSHEGLHTYRVVRGVTKEEAELRGRLQKEAWDARWARFQAAEAARQERIKRRNWGERQADIDRRAKNEALKLTKQAENEIATVKNLLTDALSKDHIFDWKRLRDTTSYTKPEPSPPELKSLPLEPTRVDVPFKVAPVIAKIGFIDWIVPGARQKKQSEAESITLHRRNEADRRYQDAHAIWNNQCDEIKKENEAASANYEKAKAAKVLDQQVFYEKQNRFNLEIERLQKQYFNRSEVVT